MQGSDDPDSEEGARCGAVSEDSNPMTFCSRIKVLKMNVAVLPLTSNLVNLIKIELLNDNSRWWFLIRWGGLNEYRDEGTSNQCDWRTTTHIWENLGDLILTILFWQLFLLFWFFFFFPFWTELESLGSFLFGCSSVLIYLLSTYASCTVLDAWGEGRLL